MFRSIRSKLLYFVIIMILLTVIPLVLISTSLMKESVMKTYEDNVSQQVGTLHHLIDVFYESVDDNIRDFAQDHLVRSADSTLTTYYQDYDGTTPMRPSQHGGVEQKIYERFDAYGKTHPSNLYVYMGTETGAYIQWPETRNKAHFDSRARPWYKLAKSHPGEVVRTEPYIDGVTGGLIVSTVLSFKDLSGRDYGVMAIDVDNNKLTDIMANTKIGETGYVVMLHKVGFMLADPEHPENNGKKLADIDFPNGQKMLEKQHNQFETTIDGKRYLVDSFRSDHSDWVLAVLIETSELNQAANSIRNTILMVTVGILLLIAIITFFVSGRAVRPIMKMVEDLKAGEGDLTMRLAVKSKDEVGELASWFNIFLAKLQEMVRSISDNTEEVDGSARELNTIADQLQQNARNSADQSATAAAATEELNSRMTSVAAAMEESTTNTNMVAGAAEHMNETITEIAENVKNATEISENGVEHAMNTSAKMAELDEAAQAISKVTETITDISEQTNLLALNATIEAARAGEAGKGFAVVANEIKELAQQTAEATGDIREKIAGVQHTSAASVSAINDIVEIINQINGIITTVSVSVEQQTMTTREIADGISQASLGLVEVNENVNHSSAASSAISGEIQGVNTVSGEVAERSNYLAGQAVHLQELAGNLQKVVNTFKI